MDVFIKLILKCEKLVKTNINLYVSIQILQINDCQLVRKLANKKIIAPYRVIEKKQIHTDSLDWSKTISLAGFGVMY